MFNLSVIGEVSELQENIEEFNTNLLKHATLPNSTDSNHFLPLTKNLFLSNTNFDFSETLTTDTLTTEESSRKELKKKRCCLCNIF